VHKAPFGIAVLGLGLLAGGCKRTPPAPSTELTVGLQSEPMGGVVSALHVVVKVGGVVSSDETVKPEHGSRVGFPQPWEKTLRADGKPDALVETQIDAIGDPNQPPLFTRLAAARFAFGKSELLRVQLEPRCIVYPVQQRRPDSKVPGPLSGPTCTAPATCIQGICQSSIVAPAGLETYAKNWPTNAPDRCKPRNAGPPVLQVGTGQSYYLPMKPDQVLTAEAGPQGGHHVWIATRMHNLKQAGTITKVQGIQPDTKVAIPPTTLAFTYAPDEGDFCKLFGIRYQLDNEGIDYKQFLGKPLDIVVTVTDPSGSTATTTSRVNIAPNVIGQ
jgi:hypothetical protein